MRRAILPLFAVCLACGSFDRRDGALVISLTRVPSDVDRVQVAVRAGGRSFEETLPKPSDDTITSFTAVPAGMGELDVRLFAGNEVVDARLGIPIEIVEDTTIELEVNFENGPDFEICNPPEGTPHFIKGTTFIPVRIDLVNDALDVEMTALVDETPIALLRDSGGFGGIITPLPDGLMPVTLTLKVTSCLVAAPSRCIERTREIEVTRARWKRSIAPDSTSRARREGDRIVLVDGAGMLHVFSSTSGEDLFPPRAIEHAVSEDFAILDGTAYVATRDALVYSVRLEPGAALEAHDLGATSGPTAGEGRVIVGAESELIDVLTEQSIATLPRRIRAAPLIDQEGVVAVDIFGHVLALDATDAELFRSDVAAPVYAAPVRYRGRVVIATNLGALVQLDANGLDAVPPIEIGAPLFHAPIVENDRLIVAADDRVIFIEDDAIVAEQSTNGTITGAPVAWVMGGVIVGLQSGVVRWVTETDSRPIQRVFGAALTPLILEERVGIAIAGSNGDFTMLEPEETF